MQGVNLKSIRNSMLQIYEIPRSSMDFQENLEVSCERNSWGIRWVFTGCSYEFLGIPREEPRTLVTLTEEWSSRGLSMILWKQIVSSVRSPQHIHHTLLLVWEGQFFDFCVPTPQWHNSHSGSQLQYQCNWKQLTQLTGKKTNATIITWPTHVPRRPCWSRIR